MAHYTRTLAPEFETKALVRDHQFSSNGDAIDIVLKNVSTFTSGCQNTGPLKVHKAIRNGPSGFQPHQTVKLVLTGSLED